MVDQGSLMISEVQSSDGGKYECSAQSMAGSKTGKIESQMKNNHDNKFQNENRVKIHFASMYCNV